jgi:hypothetical protein
MRTLMLAALSLPLLAAPAASQTGATEAFTLSGEGGRVVVAGYEIDAEQVRFPEAGGFTLSGATLTRPGRDGHVLIRELEMPDTALLGRMLDPLASCDPAEARSGVLTARDVRFRPDSDLGVPEGKEEIRIPLLTVDLSLIGCSWRASGSADAVVISGVDGSRIDVTTIEGRFRLSGPELREVDARLDLFGVSLTGVDGPGGVRFEEAGLSLTGDLSGSGLPALVRSGAPMADLVSTAAKSVLRGGIYMRGAELIPGLFLSEGDLKRTGLDKTGVVTGSADISAALEMGVFRFRSAADLTGLVSGELVVSGTAPAPDGIAIPSAISGSVPLPAELIGLSLDRVTLRYEDLGIGQVISHLSGRDPADLASGLIGERIERVAGRLPGGLPATVQSGWGSVLNLIRSGSGAVGLRPDEPFSLLEMAVSGMMGPEMAGSRTGAWSEN